MKENEFIKQFGDIAVANYKTERVLPSMIIAQSIIESGFGTSDVSKHENYFGLNWYNDSVTKGYRHFTYKYAPQERDGKMIYQSEEFCDFDGPAQCMECLYKWYHRDKPAYKALHETTDYKKSCELIHEAGYATDSKYTDKLIKTIEKYNLVEWDHKAFATLKSSKFNLLVIAGHGDGDHGATGNGYNESDLNRELAKLVVMDANKTGCINAGLADTRKNYYTYLRDGGQFDFTPYDYVLEIHFNASSVTDYKGDGKLKGSMFYISQSETGRSVEDKILSNLYALGSCKAWDGVVVAQRQWPSGLLVQERVRSQGVSHGLLETCFISDKDDVYWYQKNKIMIASAIVDGIVSGFGLTSVPDNTFEQYMVRVNKLNVPIRTGAGIQYTVTGICPIGTYTIVEERQGKVDQTNMGTWCKLKSGAGWIYLGDANKL